jgi:hypothetical protein
VVSYLQGFLLKFVRTFKEQGNDIVKGKRIEKTREGTLFEHFKGLSGRKQNISFVTTNFVGKTTADISIQKEHKTA